MEIGSYINLVHLPIGRRMFAHSEVKKRAEEFALTRIVAHVERALVQDQQVMEAEERRKALPQAQFSPEIGRRDGELDRAVTGLDFYLQAQVRLYSEHSQVGRAATRIREVVFPDGTGAMISLSYAQESEAVGEVLRLLDSDELAGARAELPGLDRAIGQLRSKLDAFREVLRTEHGVPTPDEVRAMYLKGHEMLCGTVALVLGYYVDTGDAEKARALMEPIVRQQQEIRDAWRRRRRPTDIDPKTGEVIPGSGGQMERVDIARADTQNMFNEDTLEL